MTIINVSSFIALLLAVFLAKTGSYLFHPSHPRPVTYSEHLRPVTYDEHIDHQVPDEWGHKVASYPTSVRFFRFYCVSSIVLTLRLGDLEPQ